MLLASDRERNRSVSPKHCTAFGADELARLGERDAVFERVIRRLARTDVDTWVNAPRNQGILRGWACVVNRHAQNPKYPRNQVISGPRTLLKCHKVREPSAADWDSDLACIHRAAVNGVREEWRGRDWTPAAAGSNAQLDLLVLVATTLHLLEMDKPEEWGWNWYFYNLVAVGNVLVEHAQDVEVQEELKPLRHALVNRLDEIRTNHYSDVRYVEYNRDAIAFDLGAHIDDVV